MSKKTLILLVVGLVACDSAIEPVTKNKADNFPLRANWSAAVAPVGSNTVTANVAIAEYLGSRLEASASLSGGLPSRAYQWRIFRGDCATSTPAANATAPTGLLLFATIQSYPDITTDGAGNGTIARELAGALDSLTAYSLRIRVATSQTNWNGTSPIACGDLQRS